MLKLKKVKANIWLVVALFFTIGLAVGNWLKIGMPGSLGDHACLITAAATVLLLWVAWVQLSSMVKTASADFLHKLKHDFFTPDVRRLMCLVDEDCLCFVGDPGKEYFKVEKDKVKQLNLPKNLEEELLIRDIYSAYEIDDLLLGHFEDLGIFEQQGVLNIEMVYEEFSWYLGTVWDNCAISKYIHKSRKEDGADIYDKFEYIKNKCDSFERDKLKKAHKTK